MMTGYTNIMPDHLCTYSLVWYWHLHNHTYGV
jgi:hypothetical protein